MKKLRVLLADDNKHFLNALKFMLLETTGDQIENVYEASNGEEALDIINNNMIDLVFMDIEMPKMGGIEATKKATEAYRDLVIIAVSFHSELDYIMEMIHAGARNYIVKEEINKNTLTAIVNSI